MDTTKNYQVKLVLTNKAELVNHLKNVAAKYKNAGIPLKQILIDAVTFDFAFDVI